MAESNIVRLIYHYLESEEPQGQPVRFSQWVHEDDKDALETHVLREPGVGGITPVSLGWETSRIDDDVITATDILDKCNDILGKCNDILEEVQI